MSDVDISAAPVHVVRRCVAPVRSREYRYGLGPTSQFYFCGLPLCLDTYSRCAFRCCCCCFAHARGVRIEMSMRWSTQTADTDLLLRSDGGCCCSCADLVPGFENYFKLNFLEAARQGLSSGRMTIGGLANQWLPASTIAEHVNSHSRLPKADGARALIKDYIAKAWNGAPDGVIRPRCTAWQTARGRPIRLQSLRDFGRMALPDYFVRTK